MRIRRRISEVCAKMCVNARFFPNGFFDRADECGNDIKGKPTKTPPSSD
jgi:hypothetical protein